MKTQIHSLLVCVFSLVVEGLLAVPAVAPTESELSEAARWAAAKFGGVADAASPSRLTTAPPFTFIYDGKSSAELLPRWKVERTSRELDPNRVERVLNYRDETTGLQVRGVAVEYRDFPTVEWTLYFRTPGRRRRRS